MGFFSFFNNKTNRIIKEHGDDDALFIKLQSKSSNEELENLIILASCTVSKHLRNDPDKFHNKMRTILDIKHNSSDNDEEKYVNTLARNVIYLSNVNNSIKDNFVYLLKQNKVLSLLQFKQIISSSEEAFKLPNYQYTEKDNDNINHYLNQQPISKVIDDLEFDFMFNSIYNELLSETLSYIIESDTPSVLLDRQAVEVLRLLDYYLRVNASAIVN